MAEKRRVEYMALSDLLRRFHPENAKDHDLGSLSVSLRSAGVGELPLLDERSGMLAAGHGRIESLAQLKSAGDAPPEGIEVKAGEWYVPVIRGKSFKDEAHLRAYLVASNATCIGGGWHDDLLTQALARIAGETPDLLPATGFDEDDVDRRIRKLAAESEAAARQDPPAEQFPLAVVLDAAGYERWQEWKRQAGVKQDTVALLRLLDEVGT